MEKSYEYYVNQAKKGFNEIKEFADKYCENPETIPEDKSEVKIVVGGKEYVIDFCAAAYNGLQDLFKTYLEDMGEDIPK